MSVDESRLIEGSELELVSWLMGTNDPMLRERSPSAH